MRFLKRLPVRALQHPAIAASKMFSFPAETVLEARMVREANYIARFQSAPLGLFGKQLEERVRAIIEGYIAPLVALGKKKAAK